MEIYPTSTRVFRTDSARPNPGSASGKYLLSVDRQAFHSWGQRNDAGSPLVLTVNEAENDI